ncbi:hypothetical protein AK812_SmicGene23363 [Symbiodinium microadriaticum]|uniref:Uncharacterized protein n=1 Tax=Symbiodinium microadriaticum TaxID=2951 RepID=A0A1Q9DHE5_SYMMI|nr:hypothetical protein AK812_SmicGene23363 [Symbiodinium microadriaticum]
MSPISSARLRGIAVVVKKAVGNSGRTVLAGSRVGGRVEIQRGDRPSLRIAASRLLVRMEDEKAHVHVKSAIDSATKLLRVSELRSGFPTASTYPGHGPLGGADEAATSATSSETCAMDCTPDTREEEAMLSRLGPQPRKRHWLGLESRQDSGPARESGTDVSVPRRDDPQDTAYTGSKAAEQRILLHMAPRRKPRRRPPPSSRYDQLVLLAEQSAQRRHDALYGPSLGAGLDRTLEAVQQTPVVDSRLDLQAMD